jgi:hypothetical protein
MMMMMMMMMTGCFTRINSSKKQKGYCVYFTSQHREATKMARKSQLSSFLRIFVFLALFCHANSSRTRTSFSQRLTFLLECNNPLHQHHISNKKHALTKLQTSATSDTYESSQSLPPPPLSTVEDVTKKRSHPISSVFEPAAAAPNATDVNIDHDTNDYQRRKQEWIARYTTLNGLRETFGGNRNKLWGDLDPSTTRKLYKSLLPTALCELVLDLGVSPRELAPLAYAARKAAKLYARERSRVPARVAATAYDGLRQLRRYGRFQPQGMSYDQVWDKYRRLTDMETADGKSRQQQPYDITDTGAAAGWSEEDLVAKICLKIIESSCRTNPRIDQLALQGRGGGHNNNAREDDELGRAYMQRIAQTLEEDVRRLLAPYATS